MRKFQPDNNLYENSYEGYTSSDEFIAKKRVHTTNEIPPASIFRNLHSMLKNDYWKALIGDTEIYYDLEYNQNTNGAEVFDSNGNVVEMSVAKYVNNVRSANYGPIPRKVWNKYWERDYKNYLSDIENGMAVEGKSVDDFKWLTDYSNTNYKRFEVSGVLEPEIDLILHEGYRYLSYLYPDHPDYLNILTKNEFDDKIDDTACFIDYDIDLNFMDWLPKFFKYKEGINKERAAEDEASKLKIRNLTNYAYNRKLFGSSEGYKMFASSILQHASIYGASQYIPLIGGEILDLEETPKNVDITWYKEFFDQPEEFTNSSIDKGHYLYKKLFRNIDWQNASYDFINRYKEPASFYGTAYPTPNSRFVLFEYPNERVLDKLDIIYGKTVEDLRGTIENDFKVGQKVKVGGQNNNWEEGSYNLGHISYIINGPLYKVKANVNYNSNGKFIDSEFEEHHSEDALTIVGIDTPLQALYKEFDVYPSNKKILQMISDHDNSDIVKEHDIDLPLEEKWAIHKSDADIMLTYFEALEKEQPFYKSTIVLENIYPIIKDELSRVIEDIPEVKTALFSLNPHQDGCFYLAPSQQIFEFVDKLNIDLDISEYLGGEEKPSSKIIYGTTNISDKAILKEGDYIRSKDDRFISTILGISSAYLQFSLTGEGTEYDIINPKVEKANKEKTAKFGLVFKLSKNNIESYGKKVIVFGKPTFQDVTHMEDNPRKYSTKSVYFDLKAIPTTKDHTQLRTIYSDSFSAVALKKYNAIVQLYGNDFSDIEDDFARTTLDNIVTCLEDYEELDKHVQRTNRAIDNESIYYDDTSIYGFDTIAEKTISDLNARPVLEIKAKKDYDKFDSQMTDMINNLIKDYRNTVRMELLNLTDDTTKTISNAAHHYVSSLTELVTDFYNSTEKDYNQYIDILTNLEGANDLEAPKIKKGVLETFAIYKEKVDALLTSISDFSQIYNDSNWTAIESPMKDTFLWFKMRFPLAKENAEKGLAHIFEEGKVLTDKYTSDVTKALEDFNLKYQEKYNEYITALDNSETDLSAEKEIAINKFTEVANAFNGIEEFINKAKTILDSQIQLLNDTSYDYCDYLIERFTDIDKNNRLSKADSKKFKDSYKKTLKQFITIENNARSAIYKYVYEYTIWFSEEVAIYYKDIFYEDKLDVKSNDNNIREPSLIITDCDRVLFGEMLPNRALLLSPLPEDLLMRDELVGDFSYSLLTEQDEFDGLYTFKKNSFDDLLELQLEESFGRKGILTNCMSYSLDAWDFGSINTASLAETHFEEVDYATEDVSLKDDPSENFLGEYYSSSKPWIQEYNIEDPQAADLLVKSYRYYDLNQDIYTMMNSTDIPHKFAYGDINLLESFLPDEALNNIRGEVLNYNQVKINCHLTQDSDVITLEDFASIKKLDYITTGDQIIGKTVDDDTIVKSIDLENHTITVNKPMQITGEFVLTFLCLIQYEPDDISDKLYNFRIAVSKNKEASNNSILEHGALDTPEYGFISNHMLKSYVDFAAFREELTDNLQEQSSYRDNFNLLVKNFYNRYLGTSKESDTFVKPSMIETENDIFFEIDAYTMMDEEYIMKQEVLDYFYRYLDEMTKAQDISHLGVAINGYTTNDGKVSQNESLYSDENIHSRFVTTDDWKTYEPYYIKIGNGLIPNIFNKAIKEIEEENEESLERSLYNEHDDPYGSALYSSSEQNKEKEKEKVHYYDIGNPIFKARLGEYEIQKNILFPEFSSDRTFNTLQFSIMKRYIDSFVDTNDINIVNSSISDWNGLQSWPKNCLVLETEYKRYYVMGENGEAISPKEVNYLGVWTPLVENEKLIYPEAPLLNDILNYYVVTSSYSFIINGETISFKPGQIIVWEKDEWNIKNIYACGFIGDSNNAKKYITNKYEEEKFSVGTNLSVSDNVDLRASMLYKILYNIGCYANISSAANYGYSKLLELYNNALAYFNNKKTYEEASNSCGEMVLNEKVVYSFDNSSCYWFQFIGFNDEVTSLLDKNSFKSGTFIAAIYMNNNFEFVTVSMSQLLFFFNHTHRYLSNSEYRTLFGLNAVSTEGKYPYLISEKIEAISNNIYLRDFDGLVPGSFSSTDRIKIPYTAQGLRYYDDETISNNPENISLVEDYIYADEINKKLFTYNMVEGKATKFALVQEQNKYFKNIINNIVAYNKEETLTKDGLIRTGIFSQVTSFQFDNSYMSLNDRILSVKPIDIRSAYNIYLEPRLYSKYAQLKGTLKGIIYDGSQDNLEMSLYNKTLKWNISNEFGAGMNEYLNKSSFASVLNTFKPNNKLEENVYQENDLYFDESSFEGNVIAAPKVTKIDVLDKISTENGVTYYKNNLVIEGTIDESDPTTINFTSDKSLLALSNIVVGDNILEIASLTNGSNTFNQVEVGLSGIRFIDYRNNKFIVCADSGIKVCELLDLNIEALRSGLERAQVQSYVIDGVDLTREAQPSMLIWDDDLSKWMIAFKYISAEVGLGLYYINISENNTVFYEIVDYNSQNSRDFDKFQLINPYISENIMKLNNSDNKLISHEYFDTIEGKNIPNKMLLRDLAIRKIDEFIDGSISTIKSTIPSNSLKPDSKGKISTKIQEYTDSMRDFIELKVDVSDTNSKTELSLAPNKVYWIYNNKIGKWIFYQTEAGQKLYLGDHGDDSITVKAYYISYPVSKKIGIDQDFETDAWGYNSSITDESGTTYSGEFLWKIPRPVTNNEIIVVQVETQASYDTSLSTDDNNRESSIIDVTLQISNATLSNIVGTLGEIINLKTDLSDEDSEALRNKTDIERLPYETGPYVPGEDKTKVMRGCSNADGIDAVVVGNSIFIKSPTKLWTATDNKNYSPAKLTTEYFWKMAKLPRFRDISQNDISKMTLEEAYIKVAAMRAQLLNSSKPIQNTAFYTWINNNEVIYYQNIDDIPTQIELKDISYAVTPYGSRPTFWTTHNSEGRLVVESELTKKINSAHTEKYIAAEDISLSLGYASESYLKEQMYLSYLKDYYEIILGCNSIENVFESGIKDIRMTDTSLIITTNENIVMSLPLDKTFSRDDIENPNNWYMLSLDANYEIPHCDSNSYENQSYLYGSGEDGFVNYVFGPKMSTYFGYEITCGYAKDNFQVYGGTLSLNNSAVDDYVSFLKTYNNDLDEADKIDYSWLDKNDKSSFKDKHLFISYSADGGRTFTTVDLEKANISMGVDGGTVDTIYRVDDVIRVIYHKKDEYFEYDINILGESLEESLIEKQYVNDSDKDYKAMNKNFYIGGNYECLIDSPINGLGTKNSFIISMPGTFAGGLVSSVSATSLTYSPNSDYDVDDGTTNIRVLLAIKTSKQIYDQFKYLDFKEDYFNNQGKLRVSESTLVENSATADRAFSINETLPFAQASIYSIPSYGIDSGNTGTHNIYKYNTSYSPNSTEKVYTPIVMTNFEGNEIYLCSNVRENEGQNFLIYRNKLIGNNMDFKEVLKNYASLGNFIDSVQRMYDINSVYEFSVNDEFMTGILNKYALNKNFLLKELHFGLDNPYAINITTENTDEDIVKLSGSDASDSVNYFLKWPTVEGNLQKKLCGPLGLELKEYDGQDTDEGLAEFITKLQLLEKALGNLNDNLIAEYFKPIKVYASEDEYFYGVYEVYSKTVLMLERVVKETISMTYEFGSNFSYLDNSTLTNTEDLDKNNLSLYTSVLDTTVSDTELINSIAIDPMGYGSSISNLKWDDKLPQDIDPKAWKENTLLFNSNREPIFLSDYNGNNISMRKGLFYIEKGNIYNISHDNLYAEDSVVDIFDGTLVDNKSTFHFYRLPESDIEIWVPFEKIDFTQKDITYFKIYRGGVALTKEEFDKNYSIKYSKLYKENLDAYIGLAIEFDGNKLSFNDIYDGGVVVENDQLEIIVTDKRSGKSASIVLHIDNCLKLLDVPTEYSSYTGEESKQVVYTISKVITKMSILDKNIGGSLLIEDGKTTLSLTISKLPENKTIILYDEHGNSENLTLNIAELSPVLYTDRDWEGENLPIENINVKVYSEDIDITDQYDIIKENSLIKASCKNAALSILRKEISRFETTIKIGDIDYNDKFVYSFGETNTLIVNRQEDFLVRGIFGQVILLAPYFKNFKELIDFLGRMIDDKDIEEIYNVDTASEKISITSIENSSVKIDNLLNTEASYLRIKILPVSSIVLPTDVMNNSDYYTEIGIDDIDFYGYDRVCINENVFMAPPLNVNGQYFNSDSVSQYTIESWENKDGYPVYLSDEKGKYVKGVIANHKLVYKVIGNDYGNCSEEIYQSVNPRLNPTELIYKTAYDYYYNTYYCSSKKSNPFFRFLKVGQVVKDESIIDEYGIYQQRKSDGTIVLKKDETFDVIQNVKIDVNTGETYKLSDIVDETEGTLNYTISCQPSKKEYNYLAGIKYKDYMYDSDIVSDKKYCSVPSDLIAKFAILSKEDLTNTQYEPVLDITEVGIFSKEGYLLAYMHHPIVQYNTKKNHLSYNLIIENI
ncbi:MAG: hypothetical protein HUJ68_13880 [Clostridia bacterium]|nr:hypothetical protein [Clostridia bacterium]